MEDGTFTDDEIAVQERPVPDVRDILKEMITLERFCYSEMGTFGTLTYKDFECFTVERPWANNSPFISCIPPGIYPIKLGMFYQTEKPYKVWELKQVPNRTDIDIHIGNTKDDLKGCIALGTLLGTVNKLWAVLNSREAHKKFMAAMRAHGADKADRMYVNIRNLDIGTWSAPSYATTK